MSNEANEEKPKKNEKKNFKKPILGENQKTAKAKKNLEQHNLYHEKTTRKFLKAEISKTFKTFLSTGNKPTKISK